MNAKTILLLAGSLLFGAGATRAQVSFPDAKLSAAIHLALGIPGPISESQLLTLTNLNLDTHGITDTTGLDQDYNLQYLVLNSDPVTNFSGLPGLTNLTELDFINASVPSLYFMTKMQKLRVTYLYGNSIQDVTPLAGLTNLTYLSIANNDIHNAAAIAGLTNLQLLLVYSNPVTNAAPLADLVNLTNLDIGLDEETISNVNHIYLTNISFMAGMTGLQSISIYGDQVVDYSPLQNLTDLTGLDVDYSTPTNASLIGNLTNLTFLAMQNNSITNIGFLSGLTRLQHLELDGNLVPSLTPLSGLTNLSYLIAGSDPALTNFTGLEGLTNLTTLELSSDSATNLTPLSGLTNLQTLELYGDNIADLTPVAGLTQVSTFFLGDNAITDVSPLAGLYNLQTLYLPFNQITNVAPLRVLTNLDQLALSFNSITNISPLAPLTLLYELTLDNNDIYRDGPLAGMTNLTTLTLNGNLLANIDALTNLVDLQSLDISYNTLNLNSGSDASNVVSVLQTLGASVVVMPQNPSPTITAQPMSQYLTNGNTLTLTVAAVSSTPPDLYYQWYFDCVELTNTLDGRISGTDSDTLTINQTTPADDGDYYVIVSDDNGPVYSDEAIILNDQPTLSAPIALGGGQFQFTITGPPGRSYSVLYTTDFNSWFPFDTVTNTTGTMSYVDSNAPDTSRFYGLLQQ